MEELYKEYVISYFDKTLRTHGDSPAAVGLSPQGQTLRFEELIAIGDIRGKRVLDYGCGKGDQAKKYRSHTQVLISIITLLLWRKISFLRAFLEPLI
jgi:ubiquinone/menaquinone biosynthesis C-methylase UbiE